MNALLIVFGGLAFATALILVLVGRGRPRRRRDSRSSQDYEVQFQIEEHDIEQMLDARDELRRRSGRPAIGDDLADELRPHLRDG